MTAPFCGSGSCPAWIARVSKRPGFFGEVMVVSFRRGARPSRCESVESDRMPECREPPRELLESSLMVDALPVRPRASTSRRDLLAAGACALILAVFWIATLPRTPAFGWDESMHAELPAARMVVALRHFEIGRALDALLDCSQYPFVWPACLALV